MALVRSVAGNLATALSKGWRCAATPPGSVEHPSALAAPSLRWLDAAVPGTAAAAMASASAWDITASRDFDDEDWWFVAKVPEEPLPPAVRRVLRFEGLATCADVWLDGEPLLHSDNMFLGHEIDVSGRIAPGSELAVRCASLTAELKKRRPRPRWRAQTVAQQQLRWVRTTLLGRIPAWMPPAAPVGPYRPVLLESQTRLRVVAADVRARLEGGDGVCDVSLRLAPLEGAVEGASISVGQARAELQCTLESGGTVMACGSLRVPGPELWWPVTHGTPALHDVRAFVQTSRGSIEVDLGRTGFREVELDEADGGFGLRVNGVDVFCRGASWTPLDVVGLTEDSETLAGTLDAVCAAGMNMLRLNGTMLYGSAAFHDACDARGILVWQDFMFANMDYPIADAAFAGSVRAEAEQVMARLQLSPSLVLACGNSEVEQQAAMLGLPVGDWRSPLFTDLLPSVVRSLRPDVPWVTSTPTGGALPFSVNTGVSHYYGVGAYRRPPEDARRADVRFTSECLAFANVPSEECIEDLMGGAAPPNHPSWKARVPRDKGVGWDFDDVRDHYLATLFGVDPTALRFADIPRYLELGRLASGEAMARAMAEWRRGGSRCRGALVWFLRDLWPGAGWGVLDARGQPKAAYHFLKRTMQPTTLLVTDEGLNGLSFHAVNDSSQPIEARLRLVLYRDGHTPVAEGEAPLTLRAHSTVVVAADGLLGRFTDTTYAYRFGPPGHDAAVARLVDAATGRAIADAFHFPGTLGVDRSADLGVEANATASGAGEWLVTLRTRKLARFVAFDVRGYVADDDFFHLAPGGERTVRLRTRAGAPAAVPPLSGRVLPANAASATKIAVH